MSGSSGDKIKLILGHLDNYFSESMWGQTNKQTNKIARCINLHARTPVLERCGFCISAKSPEAVIELHFFHGFEKHNARGNGKWEKNKAWD